MDEQNTKWLEKMTQEAFSWAQTFVGVLLVLTMLFAFVVRVSAVSGESMEDTLHGGDYLLVSDVLYTPKQGDIVVITKLGLEEYFGLKGADTIVKRIIATQGQEVYVDYETGKVYVDGECIDEPYIKTPTTRRGDMAFPVTVPQGHVFVMGDNRNGSTDSRTTAIGMIDERRIVGKVLFRLYPLNQIGIVR